MGISDNVRSMLWGFLMAGEINEYDTVRVSRYQRLVEYYQGVHKRQIKVKVDQPDDNLVENYIDLIVERSISMLLGDGLVFELEDKDAKTYIDDVMKANRYKIRLHDAAQNASIYGTGFIKIIPNAIESKTVENLLLPRLVVLDPRWMKVITNVEDIDNVVGYEMRYTIHPDNEEVVRKEITEPLTWDEYGNPVTWVITNYVMNKATSYKWAVMNEPVTWEYEFPPIIHWKNMPFANEVYGKSDIEGLLELQDRINLTSSNISKILRYHAHPKTWGNGLGMKDRASWGADEIVLITGENGKLANLEMQSDLGSSREYRNDLKTAMFDISRTVDLSNMKDNLGQLTNFGLRVLYNDALDKMSTKRDLFDEALTEVVHRLLVLGGKNSDPGKIKFPDPLPQDATENDQQDGFDMDHGLVSKQTVSERRGYDYEQEQERIQTEKSGEDTLGAELLKRFNEGLQ